MWLWPAQHFNWCREIKSPGRYLLCWLRERGERRVRSGVGSFYSNLSSDWLPWGTLGLLQASPTSSPTLAIRKFRLLISILSLLRFISTPQNIAMHPLKSFENFQTRNPIRILQVYLGGDIIFKLSLFLWTPVRVSMFDVLTLWQVESLLSPADPSLPGQKDKQMKLTVLTLACALTTCLR